MISSLMATATVTMRTLLIDAGPVAHLRSSGGTGPLRGDEMTDIASLVDPAGLGFVVEDGQFTKICGSEEITAEFGDADTPEQRVIALNGRAIVPGLVDAHTHLLWSGDRSNEMRMRQAGKSYIEIAEAGGGIRKTVMATRSSSAADLMAEGRRRLDVSLRHGTTHLEAKSGYGLDTETELRLIACANELSWDVAQEVSLTWLGAHDAPPGQSREAYVEELIAEQLPAVLEQGLAQHVDVFCEKGWFTLEETERIAKAGTEGGLDLRLHVDEFADCGGLGLAAELGAATADHAGHSSDDQRAKANDAGTIQGFLPGTPHVLASNHWHPFQNCIDQGWAWSLASDFNPNCHSLSMPFAASLITQRLHIDPIAALVACSRNPAAGLPRRDGLVEGQIIEGGSADLNVVWGEHVEGWCQTPGQSPFVGTLCGGQWFQH